MVQNKKMLLLLLLTSRSTFFNLISKDNVPAGFRTRSLIQREIELGPWPFFLCLCVTQDGFRPHPLYPIRA